MANNAIAAYNKTKQPSVIAGNLVYNPATGQFLPAAGTGLSLLGTGSGVSLTANTTTIMLLGFGVLMLLMMLRKR